MPDPEDLCRCGHRYKIHILTLFDWICTGKGWVDYKVDCGCTEFIPVISGERWVA